MQTERRPNMLEVVLALAALVSLDLYMASLRHSRGR
jgi:hypothetical protein